jgi:hypothetical protein
MALKTTAVMTISPAPRFLTSGMQRPYIERWSSPSMFPLPLILPRFTPNRWVPSHRPAFSAQTRIPHTWTPATAHRPAIDTRSRLTRTPRHTDGLGRKVMSPETENFMK